MNLIDGPTIPQLARKLGVPRRTMFYRLMAMHAKDRKDKALAGLDFIPWLYRYAQGPWRVNLSRLEDEHPEVTELVNKAELVRRVNRLERTSDLHGHSLRDLVQQVRVLASDR